MVKCAAGMGGNDFLGFSVRVVEIVKFFAGVGGNRKISMDVMEFLRMDNLCAED